MFVGNDARRLQLAVHPLAAAMGETGESAAPQRHPAASRLSAGRSHAWNDQVSRFTSRYAVTAFLVFLSNAYALTSRSRVSCDVELYANINICKLAKAGKPVDCLSVLHICTSLLSMP